MGGGDLNTKKSWHPNTMKNQERVWKAEQAAAEEKKRIHELQRERDEERDRAQLKEMAQRNFGSNNSGENRLHWMYDNKPDRQTQQEDYLLGKAIGKTDEGENSQQNAIPAVSRRVVGSSMLNTGDDTQVDLARKLREDPLLLVKERERAARAALLNNPLQRKKLAELLRKEQEQKEMKSKKKSKKKAKDLDNVLAAKLNALGGKKGIDLNSLLNSDTESSESSSSAEKSKKKKKKRKNEKKKPKKKKRVQTSNTDTESSDNDVATKKKTTSKKKRKEKDSTKSYKIKKQSARSETDSSADDTPNTNKNSLKNAKDKRIPNTDNKFDSKKRKSDDYSESDGESKRKRRRHDSEQNRHESTSSRYTDRNNPSEASSRTEKNLKDIRRSDSKDLRRNANDDSRDQARNKSRIESDRDRQNKGSPRKDKRGISPAKKQVRGNKTVGLSEEEKAAKLAEMVAAGAEREADRGVRVARQRAQDAAESRALPRSARNETRALPDSLEDRIRSNRHYIQRDRLHMNEHFARR